MRGLLTPPPHPWLAGYTKEGSQSAPWSDSSTSWPEEEASTVHCCLECERMHSLHSAWAGRTFLLGGTFPSMNPAYPTAALSSLAFQSGN